MASIRLAAPQTMRELELRAQALCGHSVAEVASALGLDLPVASARAKGFVGQLLERALGASPAAGDGPDFPDLGVELKSIPVARSGRPVESTFCCSINMAHADQERWEDSRLRRRLARVLWVPVEAAREAPLAERHFGKARLWQPSASEWGLVQGDWEELMGLVALGERPSGRQGRVLQIRPKAPHSRARVLSAGAEGPERVLPLGFYLRARFTGQILRAIVLALGLAPLGLTACSGAVARCQSHADCAPKESCVESVCRPRGDGDLPFTPTDRDEDGIADGKDNCIDDSNPDQSDLDGDGTGDACDLDRDGDGIVNEADNCPGVPNPEQANQDGDMFGDACDPDIDGDGLPNELDDCPLVSNPQQEDQDRDGVGDVCDPDRDGDRVLSDGDDSGVAGDHPCRTGETTGCDDNCPTIANPGQEDTGDDGVGDACQDIKDADWDGVTDAEDNCAKVSNPDQKDADLDGLGDACDPPTLRQKGLAWDPSCQYIPPAHSFAPVEKWHWPIASDAGVISYPAKTQVMSTPTVANLTDDNHDGAVDQNDVPEIIFISFDAYLDVLSVPPVYRPKRGVLRVVDGATGKTRWTAGDGGALYGFYLAPASSVAVGDLDGDGVPEIVALKWPASGGVTYATKGLVAFKADGTLLWDCADVGACFTTDSPHDWGGPSIADLDQDGEPEIVFANLVFHADGTWWPSTGCNTAVPDGTGDNFPWPGYYVGPLSFAVDLDANGSTLELVAGRSVYRLDSTQGKYVCDTARSSRIASAIETVLTLVDPDPFGDNSPSEQDGFPAVGNFDGDPALEMVLVADEFVFLLDDDGTLLDAIHALPPSIDDTQLGTYAAFGGGSPTVADFDGDGSAEIGVAGGEYYGVLDVDGNQAMSILWTRPISEVSSSRTGSSVFDFDGDGRSEVVYNDEEKLHIYATSPSGSALDVWDARNTSLTAYEYPVVADIDNDGNAEILVAANNFGHDPSDTTTTYGVRVFEDASDNWVPARRIWNQHAYHITNVDEDGHIPTTQAAFATHNSFRQNSQSSSGAPDLRAPELAIGAPVLTGKCAKTLRVGIWVENRGAMGVGSGVSVSVFAGPPASGTLLAAGQTTGGLEPGEAELVVVELASQGSGAEDAWAVVDEPAHNNECNESNNAVNLGPLGC